ncbi:hypothetical protein BX661DRAFT_224735 [Kickxella alabastrina]|uniref:uncharacterized protein n=1 Tax=Kickxella alabastrina TaxID=61397 RepID=UPI00221F8EF4|nr:uncharacterized protein BX661DRAFT_224735 [Kickxella alabastrina]KAI7827278.1 hypothetical protein BX661DRAFT_224735 [Kickxella alabastrina]
MLSSSKLSMLLLSLVLLVHQSLAMNITCPAFQSLQKVTYDNVAPQALARVIIAFESAATNQTLDAYRDALICRGSTINTPYYNTKTLTGFTSLQYANALQTSAYVVAVELDSKVTALQQSSAGASASDGNLVTVRTSVANVDSFVIATDLANFGLDNSSSNKSHSSSSSASSATKRIFVSKVLTITRKVFLLLAAVATEYVLDMAEKLLD